MLLEKQSCWLKSLWVDQIFLLLTAPEWSLPIPPICLSGQSQPSSMCVHHAALVLNFPCLLLNSWKSNGRVLGGRRLLYASEKEQSVPTEGSSTTVLQNMYIPRLSCHPRFLCSCRPLSFLLSFSLLLQFVQGDGELFCQNLNGKRNKPTTSLPFITGCLVLNSQNHRDSIVWPKHLMPKFDVKVIIWFPALFLKVHFVFFLFFFPFAFTCLLPPLRRLKIPFKNITRADVDQNETESSCIHHFSCLSPLLGEMAENWT